jgi:hypothetical protein
MKVQRQTKNHRGDNLTDDNSKDGRMYEIPGRFQSGRFDALKSDSTHHFFRNACTKSESLRFSQFSGC